MGVSQTSSDISCLTLSSTMSSSVVCLLMFLAVVVHFGLSEGRNDGTFHKSVLERTNRLRRKHGIGMLREDAALEKSAQNWAAFLTKDHVCKFYHQSPLPAIAR